MKKYLLFFILLLLFTNCKQPEVTAKKEFYIIPSAEAINKQKAIDDQPNPNEPPPPPPPPPAPQELRWYSDVVFVFDAKDKVYLYQTENIFSEERQDKPIYDYQYPNYIGLDPQDLLVFDDKDFLPFLKANNDVFKLIGNSPDDLKKFFYIASETDTIENQAFYDFKDYLKKEQRLVYVIRKTTEEENVVLQYKRDKNYYDPKAIKWSTQFIIGNALPFSEDYQKTEREVRVYRRAKASFKKGNMQIGRYL